MVKSFEIQDKGQDDDEVYDIQGNPADKSQTGGWISAGLILATELSERIVVMGITMNLVTYLKGVFHLSAPKSAMMNTDFMGTLNLLALVVGFLADAKLGRFLTVFLCALITLLGDCLLIIATTLKGMRPPPCRSDTSDQCVQATGSQMVLLFIALYTVALGAGGIKANVSTFGADQFDEKDPKEKKAMDFFFNRFYLFVSVGSLFSVTVLVYIEDNVGRNWGYLVAAIAMVVAVALLIIGAQRYRLRRPAGSPLTVIFRSLFVVAVALLIIGAQRYRLRRPAGSPLTVIFRSLFVAWNNRNLQLPNDPTMLNLYQYSKIEHTQRFRWLDKAAIPPSKEGVTITASSSSLSSCLPSSWSHSRSLNEVEDVKMVINLLPIWSTCILFWTVYSQMSTFSVNQSKIMDRRIGNFEIPPASMAVFLTLSVILFTSLNEKVLVPLGNKYLTKNNKNVQGVTSLQRIGLGLFMSILAMAAAALNEKRRREHTINGEFVSVFWLVPQYFLVGGGEAFVYVGQLEFFIREAPDGMKSMSLGLSQTSLSMGYYVSSLLVFIVNNASHGRWLNSDLNKGRLEYFYTTLAVLGTLNFIIFLGFSRRHAYKIRHVNVAEEEEIDKI